MQLKKTSSHHSSLARTFCEHVKQTKQEKTDTVYNAQTKENKQQKKTQSQNLKVPQGTLWPVLYFLCIYL